MNVMRASRFGWNTNYHKLSMNYFMNLFFKLGFVGEMCTYVTRTFQHARPDVLDRASKVNE